MKLNSFKFQDGKVFWLPEYPEKEPPAYEFINPEDDLRRRYDQAIAQSLASAIEVAPDDVNDFKLLWERTYRGVPMSGEVYSAECEMETEKQGICCSPMKGGINHHGYCDECPNYSECQVARLKHTPNP